MQQQILRDTCGWFWQKQHLEQPNCVIFLQLPWAQLPSQESLNVIFYGFWKAARYFLHGPVESSSNQIHMCQKIWCKTDLPLNADIKMFHDNTKCWRQQLFNNYASNIFWCSSKKCSVPVKWQRAPGKLESQILGIARRLAGATCHLTSNTWHWSYLPFNWNWTHLLTLAELHVLIIGLY